MAQRGVRVSAGVLKGRSIAVPRGVRPTESRVREALFDILGPALRGKSFLDLFAGSGAVGLEALSRGAGTVLQVDGDPRTVEHLSATYRQLALADIDSYRLDLPDQIARLAPRRFDWVFADPPYDFPHYAQLVRALPALLAPDGISVVEHESGLAPPDGSATFGLVKSRRYGGSVLSFYEASSSSSERLR